MKSLKPRTARMQRALVATGPGVLTLKRIEVPRLAPGEVLVRTVAVALNPSDHKFLDQITTIGATSGSDFAGIVVRVGHEITNALQLGDRVLGPASGSSRGNGAFAQYVAVLAGLCVRLPDDLDFTAAASLPTAIYTMGFVFRSLGIKLEMDRTHPPQRLPDESEEKEDTGTTTRSRGFILVHGGATATGTMALQLFSAAGYTPLATCSPSNFELVRSRGASAAFDYTSPAVRDDIRELTKGKLSLVLYCIGDPASTVLCYGAIGDEGGRYATLEPYSIRLAARRRDVKPDWVLAWTLFGKELNLPGAYYRPAIPEDFAFGCAWAVEMERLLAAGMLQSHPLDIVQEGLPAVIPGLDLLRKRRVRGKKIIIVV